MPADLGARCGSSRMRSPLRRKANASPATKATAPPQRFRFGAFRTSRNIGLSASHPAIAALDVRIGQGQACQFFLRPLEKRRHLGEHVGRGGHPGFLEVVRRVRSQAELVFVRDPELPRLDPGGNPVSSCVSQSFFRPTLAARPFRVQHPGDLIQDRIGLPFLPGVAEEARKLIGLFRAEIGRDLLLLAGIKAARPEAAGR